MTSQPSDALEPDDLTFINMMDWRVLLAAATHRLDLNDLACWELAKRGFDQQGQWVGFSRAREMYEQGRSASLNARAVSREMPRKTILMTIAATVRVHEERPAMDDGERKYVEAVLNDAVRSALLDSFLHYEPSDRRAAVSEVVVTFSGHVTA